MLQLKQKFGLYAYLFCLTIGLVGCQNQVKTPPTVVATPVMPEAAPAPVAVQPPKQDDAEIYQQALSKAAAANAIRQSALSKDDWLLIADSMQSSVDLLKSISPQSSQSVLAAKILPEYQQKLAAARAKSTNFVPKAPPRIESVSTANSTPIDVNNSKSFSIPIVQKLGGIPVIDVTFNGGQTFRMLLDTGASRTLINRSMSNELQLKIIGKSQAQTANGVGQFGIGAIDSIKFGAGEMRNVMVAIGGDDLSYGLLGHDVYDGYDITIKENAIEFKQR
jgi:predicted aspartyl protease